MNDCWCPSWSITSLRNLQGVSFWESVDEFYFRLDKGSCSEILQSLQLVKAFDKSHGILKILASLFGLFCLGWFIGTKKKQQLITDGVCYSWVKVIWAGKNKQSRKKPSSYWEKDHPEGEKAQLYSFGCSTRTKRESYSSVVKKIRLEAELLRSIRYGTLSGEIFRQNLLRLNYQKSSDGHVLGTA